MDETVTVTLVLQDGYRFETLDAPSATVTIDDDDAPPAVTATLSGPDAVDEDAGTATWTVTLGGSPSADVDVTWAVTGGGAGAVDADADPEDFGDPARASGGSSSSSPLTFAMDGAEGSERVRFSWSCARGASRGEGSGTPGTACGGRDDWWMEGHLGRYTSGDAGGTFAIAHAGIDRLVGSNLLVGLAVQYDRVDREGRRERTDGGPVAKISADGWMAGPYLTARLDDRIYLDAGIGIGTATNRITMSEGGVSGTFDSRRFSAHATLLGDLDHGGWTIRPKLGFSWYGETAGSWTGLDDGGGGAVTIPEVDVSIGDLEAGMRFSRTMEDGVSSQYFELDGSRGFPTDFPMVGFHAPPRGGAVRRGFPTDFPMVTRILDKGSVH